MIPQTDAGPERSKRATLDRDEPLGQRRHPVRRANDKPRSIRQRLHGALTGFPQSLLAFTALHLCVLALNLPYLSKIPGWFFKLREKPAGPLWLVAALAAVPFAIVHRVLAIRGRHAARLVALVLLGGAMQHGFALLEGRGLDGMRDRIVHTGHADFARAAAAEPSVLGVIVGYDEKLFEGSLGVYANSKPPGQLVLYMVFERLSRPFASGAAPEERLAAFQTFAALVWPFVSYLVIVPLFLLGRSFTSDENAMLASALYLFVPSVSLITLHADQVFFPLFTVFCVWLATLAFERRSLPLAIASGVAVYLAGFCTFPLFLVLPIAGATTLSLALGSRTGERGLKPLWITWGCILGAMVVTDIAFRIAFDYDLVQRYRDATAFHGQWRRQFVPSPRAYFNYAFMGTLEYVVWLGVPLAWLVAHHFRRSISAVLLGAPSGIALPSSILLALFAALALFGETKVETARLWMFTVPFCCLLAADEIARRYPDDRRRIVWWVIPLQWLTVYLTKIHQDFF